MFIKKIICSIFIKNEDEFNSDEEIMFFIFLNIFN